MKRQRILLMELLALPLVVAGGKTFASHATGAAPPQTNREVRAAVSQSPPPRTGFVLEDTTIAKINAAFASGQLTCVWLVQAYLDRIDAYDHKGPSLNAIITVNQNALKTATEMDRRYATRRS